MELGAWIPLTAAGLGELPDSPGALQVRRAEGLIAYPAGRSAMVFYAFAQTSVRAAVERVFADELAEPGARGQGELWVRFACEEGAREALEELLASFEARFGAPPLFHQPADEPGAPAPGGG